MQVAILTDTDRGCPSLAEAWFSWNSVYERILVVLLAQSTQCHFHRVFQSCDISHVLSASPLRSDMHPLPFGRLSLWGYQQCHLAVLMWTRFFHWTPRVTKCVSSRKPPYFLEGTKLSNGVLGFPNNQSHPERGGPLFSGGGE